MPGKVILKSIPHDLDPINEKECLKGSELIEVMLTWPIHESVYSNVPLGEKKTSAVRNFLWALLSLDGFTSAIVLQMSPCPSHEAYFSMVKTGQGKIFFDQEIIVDFSKSLIQDEDFQSFLEWPKLPENTVWGWSVDQWRQFFLERIQTAAKAKLKRAEYGELRAIEDKKIAKSVLRHLGKLPLEREKEAWEFALETLEGVGITTVRTQSAGIGLDGIGYIVRDVLRRTYKSGFIPPEKLSEIIYRLKGIQHVDYGLLQMINELIFEMEQSQTLAK